MNQTDLVEQLKALGEPNRLAVALLVADREWGAGEILDRLSLSQPSLSRHLKVLREAGVVRERRTGRNAYYRLADGDLARLVVSLAAAAGPSESERGLQEPGAEPENMSRGESKSDRPPAEPEDEGPKSADIEEWLL